MKSAIFFKVTTSYMTKVCMDQQQIIHFTLTSHHSVTNPNGETTDEKNEHNAVEGNAVKVINPNGETIYLTFLPMPRQRFT